MKSREFGLFMVQYDHHIRFINEPEVVFEASFKEGLITSGLMVDTGSECEEGFRIIVGVPLV